MNIGKNIRYIRTQNNMSQEEFGKLFYVTRQTVSNWENEKNFPDLKTIVDISDKFNISLDRLLKEDKEMVENITKNVKIAEKWNKYKRATAVGVGAVLSAAVISAGIYGGIWKSKKNRLENNFNSAVAELGFYESEHRVYEHVDNYGIKYVLPHQEMPSPTDFWLDFHAKYVYAYFESNGQNFMLMNIENESFCLKAENYPEEGKEFIAELNEKGELLNTNKFTDDEVKLIADNSEMIKKALSESTMISSRAYL